MYGNRNRGIKHKNKYQQNKSHVNRSELKQINVVVNQQEIDQIDSLKYLEIVIEREGRMEGKRIRLIPLNTWGSL